MESQKKLTVVFNGDKKEIEVASDAALKDIEAAIKTAFNLAESAELTYHNADNVTIVPTNDLPSEYRIFVCEKHEPLPEIGIMIAPQPVKPPPKASGNMIYVKT